MSPANEIALIPSGQDAWLSLSEASRMLGVHPNTLRRWADGGNIPCFRTPGGHRRFRSQDLVAWMQQHHSPSWETPSDLATQRAVSMARQEMIAGGVASEPWYLAFSEEQDRQRMRETGRRLFGLAIQYVSRVRNREPIVEEAKRIGALYGQLCAQRAVSLVDVVRALFFFRESLLRAAKPGQVSAGQYDAEDVRIHRQLRHFLDQVTYACLASYESSCSHLIHASAGT